MIISMARLMLIGQSLKHTSSDADLKEVMEEEEDEEEVVVGRRDKEDHDAEVEVLRERTSHSSRVIIGIDHHRPQLLLPHEVLLLHLLSLLPFHLVLVFHQVACRLQQQQRQQQGQGKMMSLLLHQAIIPLFYIHLLLVS